MTPTCWSLHPNPLSLAWSLHPAAVVSLPQPLESILGPFTLLQWSLHPNPLSLLSWSLHPTAVVASPQPLESILVPSPSPSGPSTIARWSLHPHWVVFSFQPNGLFTPTLWVYPGTFTLTRWLRHFNRPGPFTPRAFGFLHPHLMASSPLPISLVFPTLPNTFFICDFLAFQFLDGFFTFCQSLRHVT